MQRLTQLLGRIGTVARGMSATHRLLIVSLAVLMVMTLFVVHQYTAKPSMVALLDASYPAEDQQAAAQFLDSKNISYTSSSAGVVLVQPSMRPRLLAQMSQEPGTLPSDTTILFNNLLSKQSWTQSTEQNRQLEVIALQNEIANILSQWEGIRSAKVILDVPPTRAIGQPMRRPTAAVNVFSEGGLPQSKVDAIAAFVAGSRSGLTIDRVRIVDGSTGRQLRARSDDQLTATSTQELIAQIEERRQRQIADMLMYIPAVIVTVQAQVDATQHTTTTDEALPEGKGSQSLLSTESTTTRTESEPVRMAEPGVRANTGADITSQVAANSANSSENQSETTFETRFGTKKQNILDPRGFATKVNAVVNVPRSYFVTIWQDQQRRQNPDDADLAAKDPTDAELQLIADAEVLRITDDVRQMIDTSGNDGTVPGEVKVSMIPVTPTLGFEPAAAGMGGLLGIGGGAGGVALPELVKTVALGGLAVVALGLVVVTAVKSSKRETLPSASELVGIPPALGTDVGLVGEAEAAESALTGIELTEDVMQSRKIHEQVSSMIKEKPDVAATLVGRWIGDAH